MTNGKNEPILQALYKEKTGKPAITKTGEQAKGYMDFKRKNFTPMGQTILKNFSTCVTKIEDGSLDAYGCYKEAREKTVARGSVYIPPSIRIKTKKKEFQKKYDLKKQEKRYRDEFKF
ncbi:hypothetical protein ES705_26945 [subsurface metagenome]